MERYNYSCTGIRWENCAISVVDFALKAVFQCVLTMKLSPSYAHILVLFTAVFFFFLSAW
jgi:hypothetical protein